MPQPTHITSLAKNFLQQNASSMQQCEANITTNSRVVSLVSPNTNMESSNTPHSDKSVNIKWLWMAMQALYPTKWNGVMGEVTGTDGKLSVQARVWQRGLCGISTKQISRAVDHLTDNYSAFIPDLGEFKRLCLCRHDVLTIDRVVRILANASSRQGSITDRYQHPMVFAIAQSPDFDAHAFRTLSTQMCTAMVKPIYDSVAVNGWAEFLPEHYEVLLAVGHDKPRNKDTALSALGALKQSLGVSEQ